MPAAVATEAPVRLTTIGTIAADLGVPIHRVEYILRTRPHIKPQAVAGQVRLFDSVAVAQVRYVVNTIDARRASGRGGRASAADRTDPTGKVRS